MSTGLEGQGLNSGGIEAFSSQRGSRSAFCDFLNPDGSPKHQNVGGFVVSGNLGLLGFLLR